MLPFIPMRLKNIILILTLLTITGCSGLLDNNRSDDGGENRFSAFPLTVGNEWRYTRTIQITSTSNVMENTTTTGDLTINITGLHAISSTINSYIIEESLIEGSQTFTRKSYQSNQKDGLYAYEFKGQNSAILLASRQTDSPQESAKIYFKGQFFNTIRDLVAFIEEQKGVNFIQSNSIQLSATSSSIPTFDRTPVKSLEYPLARNTQWVYRSGVGSIGDLAKKVLNQESITVAAGRFDTYKIQWLWDFDNNNEPDDNMIGYEYISPKGLIKKTITVKNIPSTKPVNNEVGSEIVTVGYFDMTIEYVLTSYRLQ